VPPPTADVNLTTRCRRCDRRGPYLQLPTRVLGGYFKSYAHGPKVLIPLTVIEIVAVHPGVRCGSRQHLAGGIMPRSSD
jgi:hypothetical protein